MNAAVSGFADVVEDCSVLCCCLGVCHEMERAGLLVQHHVAVHGVFYRAVEFIKFRVQVLLDGTGIPHALTCIAVKKLVRLANGAVFEIEFFLVGNYAFRRVVDFLTR